MTGFDYALIALAAINIMLVWTARAQGFSWGNILSTCGSVLAVGAAFA